MAKKLRSAKKKIAKKKIARKYTWSPPRPTQLQPEPTTEKVAEKNQTSKTAKAADPPVK